MWSGGTVLSAATLPGAKVRGADHVKSGLSSHL